MISLMICGRGWWGREAGANLMLQQQHQQQQDYTSLFYYYNQYLNFPKSKIQKSDNFPKYKISKNYYCYNN